MLEEIINIVKRAGDIFREGYYSKKDVSFKGKKDLVTKYDVAIEEFLVKEFKRFGKFNVIGEETKQEEFNNSFIIDPIDGTTNFVNGLPFCAISVGVYENKEAKYGIVYNPILDELFVGIKGEGAFKNGEKLSVSSNSDFQKALIATGFPYSGSDNMDDLNWVINSLKNILPACQDIRRYGSASLDLCYVASGVYDGFYEINLKPWDVSAGVLLVTEAGGRVTSEFGEDYNMFTSRGIVATNGFIHNDLIEKLDK